ncbi:GNAT family N-acetyltransferase [Clostridium pasteurianum]|uniref:GNAT family N-acetyltransferase n=1 Tax=Clostridium pasteurianum TaxID=1501 RepID=UPI002260F54B|nr:GNAT family N-acetyltransferase [Clostridium pasteurianum]UZW15401.1 GNAT family N-acetyltransferase [Clostridium pasteurianum]
MFINIVNFKCTPLNKLYFVYNITAEYNNKLYGYCLGHDHYTFYANGCVAWLEEIMVVENYRKTGIGCSVMCEFENWAKSRGSKLVALATRRAAQFYKTLNYEESAVYFKKIYNKCWILLQHLLLWELYI